ncbi:uncharacterized protein C9orf85 homolog isoform X2 [Polistes fuscatus]|uniref:uncharacterized protein C9orf85 homolog isoform X2 n=1 Tax=Polistes fuscatus TaxID=30207 RepID=UPI001CA82F36|nr:uncharacterized protein C9orf85 homolog isoform X2 [Polistes fuscatus]
MSCQKGNTKRSRPQKYKNQTVFKNDLHDKSHRTKFINSIEVANVCERCKKIIEWKIKYKKYKPLKAPAKCTKCEEKTVKHAYHTMCLPCSKEHKVCPKCCVEREIIEAKLSKEEIMKMDAELPIFLKQLPERKRRTMIRFMNRNCNTKNIDSKTTNDENEDSEESDDEEDDNLEEIQKKIQNMME